jgi:hypothetical protein
MATTSSLEKLIGLWSKRRQPKGLGPHLRIDTFPNLWEKEMDGPTHELLESFRIKDIQDM